MCRSKGQSAVTVAARRSGTRLFDETIGMLQRPLRAGTPVHSEILLPLGAPPAWADREVLWNAVEAREKRKDAQLAREVEVSLPRELRLPVLIQLARSEIFVAAGMVAW